MVKRAGQKARRVGQMERPVDQTEKAGRKARRVGQKERRVDQTEKADRKEKPLGQMAIQLQPLVHPHLAWPLCPWRRQSRLFWV
jgi:hypothetical protein